MTSSAAMTGRITVAPSEEASLGAGDGDCVAEGDSIVVGLADGDADGSVVGGAGVTLNGIVPRSRSPSVAIDVQRMVKAPGVRGAAGVQESFVLSPGSIVALPTVVPAPSTTSALLPFLSASENDSTMDMPVAAVTLEPAAGLDETRSEWALAGNAATSQSSRKTSPSEAPQRRRGRAVTVIRRSLGGASQGRCPASQTGFGALVSPPCEPPRLSRGRAEWRPRVGPYNPSKPRLTAHHGPAGRAPWAKEVTVRMPVPVVSFTDERLSNGLRLIVAQDHLAPVVAVNIWYNVGSKHEVPGKTGFAHLFEHVMFQGSRNVAKAEHIALVQAAGGTMNGTTWLDRTNYFETMPSHQVELALWLEADRMGTLLDALSQENLDNQREVVKNEKRWSYDNRPYGSWSEKLQAHLFPPEHPYHHPTIGSMEDLDAASLEDVRAFFRTWYAPNNATLAVVGDVEPARIREWVERYFGGIAANPSIPRLGDLSLPATLGEEHRETVPDRVPLPRVYFGFRAPEYGDPRLDALDLAAQILAGGKGSRLHRRLVRDERIAQDVALFALGFVGGASMAAGWATVRPGVEIARVERAFEEEIERLGHERVSADELARAKALVESEELGALQRVDERADRLAMYATLLDDPGLINGMLARYLSVTPERIRESAGAVFRPDNRVVLTYVPDRAPADSAAAVERVDVDEEVAA